MSQVSTAATGTHLSMANMKLLLVGATGLVGSQVLEQAIIDPRIGSVTALARRELPAHPKLMTLLVDYERLDADASCWRADAVICTLGTTMRSAGSQTAFHRVDHDYPLAVARLAHAQGTRVYVLNSAIGADARSRFFYNRVKGELEDDLRQIGFDSLALVRPGLIDGHRTERRPSEQMMLTAMRTVAPLLPRRWRPNPAPSIAIELLNAALLPRPGVSIIPAEQMV